MSERTSTKVAVNAVNNTQINKDNQEPEALHLVPNPDNKSFFSLGHGWLVRQEGKNGKIEEIQCQKVQLTKLTASELVDPHDIAGCITLPP